MLGGPPKKVAQAKPVGMRLSIVADQLDSPVGGGRFIRGLLAELFSDQRAMNKLEHIYILATQNESVACLGALPARVSVVRRRFPSRLRQTLFAQLFGGALPAVDVAYGPFYYSFPCRARAKVVTIHDMSCFDGRFHPKEKALKTAALLTKVVNDCDGVVCISEATLSEVRSRWPHLAHKTTMIYNGVSRMPTQLAASPRVRESSILVVGTIEPRKNYSVLLDTFEKLALELGRGTPKLTVVGNVGWMSEEVERRLLTLEADGLCQWLRNASDLQLADAYAKAGVFTYMSLSEGFGYPPFEAAYAQCPMVLSSASSVGEIWSGYARCVDPLDVEGIITAWKWALSLSDAERDSVVARQERRAEEFTWSRALNEYIAFWAKSGGRGGASSKRRVFERGRP